MADIKADLFAEGPRFGLHPHFPPRRRVRARELDVSRRVFWLRGLCALPLALGFLWALFNYGATEQFREYSVFLVVLVSALPAVWLLSGSEIRSNGVVLFLLLGLFLLLQVFLSDSLYNRGYILLSLGWMSGLVVFAITRDSPRLARGVVSFLVAAGSLEAFYGFVQSVGGVDYIWNYYRGMGRMASGTFINSNHFAGMLNMILPLAVAIVLTRLSADSNRLRRSERYSRAWVWVLSCVLMGLAVLFSASRGGVAVMLATLLFMSVLVYLRKRGNGEGRQYALAICLVLVLILVLGTWVGIDAFMEKMGHIESDVDLRLPVYRDTLKLIADHPVRGVGPGMYVWRFRPYQEEVTKKLYDHAHNDYLESAAEWGLPIAVLFWAFVLWRGKTAVSVFFESRSLKRQALALGCAAGILSIVLHSLVDFNLQIPANWALFCTLLALSMSLRSKTKSATAN